MSRKVLGRGLDALIPHEIRRISTEGAEELQYIPIARIIPNPHQPRSSFNGERLEELARSIREKGILEPLLLRALSDGRYEVIAGERRLRAAQLAGLEDVPCLLRRFEGRESLEVALIENLQREDLNPVEEARAYQRLVDEFDRTHAEISLEVGKDRSTVTNLLRLLRLQPEILESVSRGTLSVGHARVLLSIEDETERQRLADQMVAEGWSVRHAEQHVSQKKVTESKKERMSPAGDTPRDREVVRVEEALRYALGTEVHLTHGPRGGRIDIRYADTQELERILDHLGIQIH